MVKRAFTLVEIMVVLIIVGVLAIIAIPAYKNLVEDGKSRMCSANLQALKRALDVYVLEHNVVPGDLSQISQERFNKAYAAVISEQSDWKLRLYMYLDKEGREEYAYAATSTTSGALIDQLAPGTGNLTICPSSRPGKRSYGLSSKIAKMRRSQYLNYTKSEPLIADSESAVFNSKSELYYRHFVMEGYKRYNYANYITSDNKIHREKKPVTSGAPSIPVQDSGAPGPLTTAGNQAELYPITSGSAGQQGSAPQSLDTVQQSGVVNATTYEVNMAGSSNVTLSNTTLPVNYVSPECKSSCESGMTEGFTQLCKTAQKRSACLAYLPKAKTICSGNCQNWKKSQTYKEYLEKARAAGKGHTSMSFFDQIAHWLKEVFH